MGEFAIGQSVSRFEDPRLLRGGGRFADDFSLPGMVHGFVLRASVAHARITAINIDAAKKMPGVLAVLTGEDWARSGHDDLPTGNNKMKRPNGEGLYRPRLPALIDDRVRWVGDPVAFVVAETLAEAIDASELIEVSYDPLPAAIGTATVKEPDAPRVWDDCDNNICYVGAFGDAAATEAAFQAADHVISQRLLVNRVTAATMEPRACIGDYDASQDRYTLRMTAQRSFRMRQLVARVMGVAESKVRVLVGDVGGSFGMKGSIYGENILTLFASRAVGRPVKWTSTRSEAFVSDCQARDNVADVAIALDADGTFRGLKLNNVVSVGAYLHSGGEGSAISNLGSFAGVYNFDAIRADVMTVFSNTNPLRSYRGNGRPEAAYFVERIIDIAADELGFDPVHLRRKNLIPDDAFPYKTKLTFTYDCGQFSKTMDMAIDRADYAGFEARRVDARKRGKLRGIGVSFTIEKSASAGYEGAEVRFDRSGTVTILSGAITQGQGHETIFKQLVADTLGLDPDTISYVQGDTDAVFYGEGSGGSRTAALGGSAILEASQKVLAKAHRIAAHLLNVDAVDYRDGVFTNRQTNETVSIAEVARAAAQPARLPEDLEPGLIGQSVHYSPQASYPNGCHVCELEIDEDTGAVEIVRYTVSDDVGTVLNPLLLKGQIMGGVAQGIGQVLMEDIKFDQESGQLLTGSLMDYPMPRALGLSKFDIVSNPVPTKANPLGVKGAGEAGTVGAVPAVANAIVDALSVLGVKHIDMPTTPYRIWQAMQAEKG